MNREIRNPESEIRNADSAVDELLVSFFRAEMPQPWPGFSARSGSELNPQSSILDPRSSTLNPQSSILHSRSSLDPRSSILHPRSSSRSRWVLAASVAILLIGSWWLGQRFAAFEPPASPTSSGKMIGKNKPPRHLSKTIR
jgi:hypothetical protein